MSKVSWEGLIRHKISLWEAAKRYNRAKDNVKGVQLGIILNGRKKSSSPEINEFTEALKELDEIRTLLETKYHLHHDIIALEVTRIIFPEAVDQIKELRERIQNI